MSSTTSTPNRNLCGRRVPRPVSREVPDVSINADEYTPYAQYCTGNASTPYSVCAGIGSNAPGWFGIGGTSLASPFWSAIVANHDSLYRLSR